MLSDFNKAHFTYPKMLLREFVTFYTPATGLFIVFFNGNDLILICIFLIVNHIFLSFFGNLYLCLNCLEKRVLVHVQRDVIVISLRIFLDL